VYRIGFFIVLVLAIALGLLIGTLNHEVVAIDLLWVQLQWPVGLSLLSAMAIGLLIGLMLAWVFSVLPLRMRLRKARQQKSSATPFADNLDA
jgi:uncharacterized integral membrane protein